MRPLNQLLSIIIQTYKRPRHLERLINSIKQYYPDLTVLVAGDIPGPEHFIRPSEAASSQGRNFLLEKVKTKYVLLLDDGHIVIPETDLNKVLNILEENSALDIVAGDLMNQGVERQTHHGMLRKRFGFLFLYKGKPSGKLGDFPLYDLTHDFFVGRTEKIKAIGWDEKIQFARGHTDFFLRAKGKLNVTRLSEFCINRFSTDKAYSGVWGHKYKKIFNKKWKVFGKLDINENHDASIFIELFQIIRLFFKKFIEFKIDILLGMYCYLFSSKRFVIIASTQRSGSTLLTQLLGQADDISLLDEDRNYYHYRPRNYFTRYGCYYRAYKASKMKTIVLKLPANPYNPMENYPNLIPLYKNVKVIFLFRNPFSTIHSIKKMEEVVLDHAEISDKQLDDYWLKTNRSIMDELKSKKLDFRILSYEELCKSPEETTQRLFKYIGSRKKEGVSTYKKRIFMWGKGDGAKKIGSGRVQENLLTHNNDVFVSPEAQEYYDYLKALECEQKRV